MCVTGGLRNWAFGLVFVLSVTGCSSPTAEEYSARADRYLSKGQLAAAAIEFKNALQKDPNHAASRLGLGRLYLEIGDNASALKELERALDLGADGTQVLPLLLQAKLELGRYQEVLGEVEQMARPLSPQYLMLEGEARRQAGDLDAAGTAFADVIAADPTMALAYIGLADIARKRGEDAEASEWLAKGIASAPNDIRLRLAKAEDDLQNRRFDLAAAAFEAARIEGRPGAADLGMARVQMMRGEFEEAAAGLTEILAQQPLDPTANFLMALVDLSLGRLDPAEDAILKVLQVDPEHPPSVFFHGVIKFRQGYFQTAERELSRFVAVVPGEMEARKLLAVTRLELSDGEGAVGALEAASQSTDDAQALVILGNAYIAVGRMSDAAMTFERATKMAPASSLLRRQLAIGFMSLGKADRAQAEVETAIELDPALSENQVLRINLMLSGQRFTEARNAAMAFAKTDASNPIWPNLIGAAHLGLGEVGLAKTAFVSALAIDPGFVPAALSLTKIAVGAGELDAAQRQLEALRAAKPESLDAQMGLAELAFMRRDFAESLRLIEVAKSSHPDAVLPLLAEAKIATATGDAARASRASLRGLEIAPENLEALFMAAEIELSHEDVATAQRHLAMAERRLRGDSSLRRVRLGQLQLAANQYDRAAENLTLALPSVNEPIPVLADLAVAELRRANLAGFQNAVDRLRSRNAPKELILLLESDAAAARGDLDAAARGYAAIASIDGVIRLYALELKRDRHAEAQAVVSAWLEKHPDDLAAQIALADIQLMQGQADAALEQYEKIAERMPGNAKVLNNLASLYLSNGDARAESIARRANEIAPKNPDIADTLGWILTAKGDMAEAIRLLESAAGERQSNPSIQYHLAAAYEKARSLSEARRQLEVALALGDFPEKRDAESLRDRLKREDGVMKTR